MKLRVLICLFLIIVIISDITAVAATNQYTISVTMQGRVGGIISGATDTLRGHVSINNACPETAHIPYYNNESITFNVTYAGPINTVCLSEVRGITIDADMVRRETYVMSAFFRVYHHRRLVASGVGLGTHTVNLACPSLPFSISPEQALNFTLAGAMALPTMTIGVVDDIMLIVGKYINCGITKFAIRAALSKYAAKGVAITVAITGISYLFAEFADDIYNAIFTTIPEINPGDSHFHEIHLPRIMDVINTHYPVLPPIRNAIEQSIRTHIDAQGLISIADVMQIIRNHQNNTVVDVYKETPEILPDNINVNEGQIPEIMDMVDQYFPTELPIRNIIEQEVRRQIEQNEFNEIPFNEIINIIEREQNIIIPEIPVQTPSQHQEYIDNVINRVIHEDPYIPTIETPAIFEGIPATPTTPRTPKRPNEKIHTFPFYSIFVDPLAAVIGITLAHLFTAMMIIGAIISIGATWGTIGAIFAGFIGTITTAYFGLTSWLIPVFLIILLIIYANIRIKGGGSKD